MRRETTIIIQKDQLNQLGIALARVNPNLADPQCTFRPGKEMQPGTDEPILQEITLYYNYPVVLFELGKHFGIITQKVNAG